MSRPMCVSWTSDDGGQRGEEQWCVAKGPLDPEAWEDATLCGRYVLLRVGSRRRYPTCPECRRKVGLKEPAP